MSDVGKDSEGLFADYVKMELIIKTYLVALI